MPHNNAFGREQDGQLDWPLIAPEELQAWQGPTAERLHLEVHRQVLYAAGRLAARWHDQLSYAPTPGNAQAHWTSRYSGEILSKSLITLGLNDPTVRSLAPIELLAGTANGLALEVCQGMENPYRQEPLGNIRRGLQQAEEAFVLAYFQA